MISVERSGAYEWLYFDADDGARALVVIFFVGSVFSPFYAARLADGARPREHAAVNVALYPARGARTWTFAEYPEAALRVRADELAIGASRVRRAEGGAIHIAIDERRRLSRAAVRGELLFTPLAAPLVAAPLELAGARHLWSCPAPRCAVEARFTSPRFELRGLGYHDTNRGEEPASARLSTWSWERVHGPDETRVSFDVTTREGARTRIDVDRRGLSRRALAPARGRPSLRSWLLPLPEGLTGRPIERAPFYARFLGPARRIAEHVDFGRWSSPLVRAMIRARLERRGA